MDLEPDHGLVLGQDLGRKRGGRHIVFDFNASGFPAGFVLSSIQKGDGFNSGLLGE